MKLQAQSSRELQKALQKSAKCVAAKNMASILDNVLLTKKDDGKMYFTTSTGDAQLTVEAPLNVVEGRFTAPVALRIELIASLLGTLPDCPVTFSFVDNTQTLVLEYCTEQNGVVKPGQVTLTYVSGEDYPLFATIGEDVTSIALPRVYFEDIVAKASNFVDRKESRAALNSLFVDVAEDHSAVTFVATNGMLLYRATYSHDPAEGGSDFFRSGTPRSFMVHSSNFRSLSVFEDCEEITLESNDRFVRFQGGGAELICKAVEGKYPNFRSIIPTNTPAHVVFSQKEMQTILKRISLFSDKASNCVSVSKNNMFLDLEAKDVDFSISASDQVLVESGECEEGLRVGFNASYLTTAVSALTAEGSIRMNITDPTRPVTFTVDDPAPRELTLCMPMMLR